MLYLSSLSNSTDAVIVIFGCDWKYWQDQHTTVGAITADTIKEEKEKEKDQDTIEIAI